MVYCASYSTDTLSLLVNIKPTVTAKDGVLSVLKPFLTEANSAKLQDVSATNNDFCDSVSHINKQINK